MNSTISKISLLALNDDSFCKTKLNGIFRVALKAISWLILGMRRGVELHEQEVTFFITFTIFFICHVFTFLTFFLIFILTFFTSTIVGAIGHADQSPRVIAPIVVSCKQACDRDDRCDDRLV